MRRFAGPAIGFLLGAGLEVSGVESIWLAVGIWGLAAAWLLIALATWKPLQRRLQLLVLGEEATSTAVIKPREAVEKGFVDFRLDIKKASEELPKIMEPLGKETRRLAERLRRHSARWPAVQHSAEKTLRAASEIAKDIDRYCQFVERKDQTFEQTSSLLIESMIGYMETSPGTATNKADLVQSRGAVEILRQRIRGSRESTAGFRNNVAELRELRVSKRVSSATERLMSDLERIITIMKDMEAACRKLTTLIDKRLAP